MITSVYFIRHARPDISIKDETRPLSLEGLKKSEELVKIFSEIKIDNIYSSPYKRAVQTIEPIANNKNIKIKIVKDFHEIKVSKDYWIGDNFNEFCKKQWNDFSYKLTGGESLFEVQKRNVKELNRILFKRKGMTIIIGTHGIALSTIINYYDKTFKYNNFENIADIMPYIIKIEFKDDKYIRRNEILNIEDSPNCT